MSLARRHRARMLGLQAAKVAPAPSRRPSPAASEYELLLARLGVDLRRLKEIQSVERKIELKRELLPAYLPWIEGVLLSGDDAVGNQDQVFVQCMIWAIDIGDYLHGLAMARYVIDHELAMPERFDRTANTFIAEEIADAALKAYGQDQDFDLEVLHAVDELVDGADIFDEVRAKLEKAIGLGLARQAEAIEDGGDGPAGLRKATIGRALGHLKRALELDDNSGVKTMIAKFERQLAKTDESTRET